MWPPQGYNTHSLLLVIPNSLWIGSLASLRNDSGRQKWDHWLTLLVLLRSRPKWTHLNLVGWKMGEWLYQHMTGRLIYLLSLEQCLALKQYHPFRFSAEQPGDQCMLGSMRTQLKLNCPYSDIPHGAPLQNSYPPIQPRGLPPERQWYLYEHIREFCPKYAMDTVSPLPCVPKQASRPTPLAPKRRRPEAET